MRKFLLAAVALAASFGIALAAPVRFVSYDDDTKELKVKEGKKGEQVEKVYKLTKDTKFTNEDDSIDMKEAVKKLSAADKKTRLDVKAGDKMEVTELKFMAAKKKN